MRMGELLGDQAPDIGQAIEQAGHDDVARQALLRQLAQRRGHGLRNAAAVGIEHLDQADIARGAGTDNCSRRGRVRGTMIAFLSKDRISQNVL